MTGGALTLNFFGGDRFRVSFFEGRDQSLRSYEFQEAAWDQIDAASGDIFAILQRSSRHGGVTLEQLDGLKKSGQILFDLLIPPHAKAKLASTTADTLTLTLDETVLHLPWELLYDGRDFLCRRFALGRIASTRQAPIARFPRSFEAPFKVLVIADPRGDLEACYQEGLDIKNFLDRNRDVFRVDFKSHPVDMAFVKKNIRDYDIVHYAGHAYYDVGDPGQSGWLLSDGTLRASEITALGGFQPMPALVFSNACQSGRLEPWKGHDAIFSLANAFLLAGVQHHVGTFSEIVDEPSLRFAKYFYQSIAAGEAVGPALRSARGALMAASEGQSLIWANYMLYGDPRIKFSAEKTDEIGSEETGLWRRLVHGRAPAPLREIVQSRTFLVCLITLLLVASGYAGYAVFSRSLKRSAESAPAPAAESASGAAAARSATTAPLNMTMNLIGQRKEPDGSVSEVVVKEGSVLRSGDNFQVQVEVNRPCHLYMLLFDSNGQASQLFPDPKIETPSFVEAARRVAVPEKDLWFWLDDRPGTETVYVLAALEPIPNLRGLLNQMAQASGAERVQLFGPVDQQIDIVERGVGGFAKGKTVNLPQRDSEQLWRIKKVTEVVLSTGAVVRAISFEHW